VAERIAVHIGTMKSGTTYLQNVLRGFDAPLREAGWLYPATWELPNEVPSHERALGGLGDAIIPWVGGEAHEARRPAWERLLAATRAWPGRVLLSAEALAAMDEQGIATLLEALPADRFRILLTARDLGRVLPSSWQQHVRNGRTDSYPAYLSAIRQARHAHGTSGGLQDEGAIGFWRSYDLPAVVRRWGADPRVEEVVIVTVPHGSPTGELWRRFRDAVPLPESIPADPPPLPPLLSQPGATAPEALIVEAFVRELEREGVSLADRAARARHLLIRALFRREDRGALLRLPREWAEEVAGWASADVEALESMRVRIVGSLDDLLVADRGVDGPIASPEEVAAAAAIAILRQPTTRPDGRAARPRQRQRRSRPRRLLARLTRWAAARLG
jgi:hypothetical protein